MENLHFISNNILTKFFKELTKYKNDYQQYLNFIYIYIGIILCILLYIFKCIYVYEWGYKPVQYKNSRVQIQLDFKLDFNWNPILHHVFI